MSKVEITAEEMAFELGYRDWQIMVLRKQVQTLQAEIDKLEPEKDK